MRGSHWVIQVGGGTVCCESHGHPLPRRSYQANADDGIYRPFFKRAETFHTPSKDLAAIVDVRHDQNSLGTDGPIQLSYNIDYSASHALWHQTLNAAGVSTNTTHTAGSNVGVFTNINSVDPRTAARSYSINYLNQDGKDLANLHILTGADVKRVDLQNEAGNCRASGVVFECEGQEYIAQASREIIVSGGSVSSPRILELSGVGNPSVLKRANVPVVVESPCVGENLQDHLSKTPQHLTTPSRETNSI